METSIDIRFLKLSFIKLLGTLINNPKRIFAKYTIVIE